MSYGGFRILQNTERSILQKMLLGYFTHTLTVVLSLDTTGVSASRPHASAMCGHNTLYGLLKKVKATISC